MKVLYLLTGPVESPGERYRAYQFLPLLRAAGHTVEVDALTTSSDYRYTSEAGHELRKIAAVARGTLRRVPRLRRLGSYDVVVMYRQPVFAGTGYIDRLLERKDVPYVFDFDDAIYLDPPGSVSRFSTLLRSARRVPSLIANASATLVANEELRRFAAQHSDSVALIPTCVDVDRYAPRGIDRRGPTVVGWIGSRSTVGYLATLNPLWARLRERYPDLVVRMVADSHDAPMEGIEARKWSLDTEVDELAGFDIGIMPLPDDRWTRGKSGLKILQYMAAGVPVVASPVGVNPSIITDGVNGYLASSLDEWIEKMLELIGVADLRAKLATEGRRTVEESYSLTRWGPEYVRVLEEASGSR